MDVGALPQAKLKARAHGLVGLAMLKILSHLISKLETEKG